MAVIPSFFCAFLFAISPTSAFESETANALEGAWEMNLPSDQSSNMRTVMTIQAPYVFISSFNVESKEFFESQGGMIEILGNTINYTVEFHTADGNEIGKSYQITTEINRNQLVASIEVDGLSQSVNYTRIDAGNSDLAGAWRITERMRNGEMQKMRLGSRKTIKMITGTRFQWVAFDPESKSFSGTGGGTVTLKEGKYTEHIEFFSRNSDRVGASLTFDYEVNGDRWVHSGLSSTGSPIKEIWTRQ